MAHTIERLTLKAEPKKILVSLWVVLNNNESSVPQDWGQALFGLVGWPRIWDAKARHTPPPESTRYFHVCTHVAVEHQKTFTKEGGKTQKGPWTWPGLPPRGTFWGRSGFQGQDAGSSTVFSASFLPRRGQMKVKCSETRCPLHTRRICHVTAAGLEDLSL